ncbi:M24 family metallopeptidase [Alkaliphilus peptidifermentans]|uniref:Xaa-Pro dipeptidase n=1 Tax=Alkaliphilus peptidifermentans DSM 18978 TaxID=1120976 RepID=A0A1G5FCG2_9FIRM|nr:Xaa-Pro peptidase family protein [Alkaliphilus peptidifermentans]SCY36893.1 Xaa-Pro dipeptidase [Alkaliphilus peptidifermentans DSM 18978]
MENLRLQKVLQEMKVNSIPHMIITDPASIYYLTNKWISPGERLLALYLTESGNHKLLINELFPLTEEIGIEKIWYKDTDYPVKILAKFIDTALIKTIGIDKNWPSRFLLQLMELKSDYNFVNGSFIIDTIRMIKDTKEIELMKEASSLNDCAIEKVIGLIAGDSSEKEICNKLIDIYDSLGTDGPSFDPIIAFGANCSDPHHEPDGSSPKPGDSVIIDIGCKKSFYCSDMTRTVFYKSVSEEGRRVYNIVKEANARAIATVKPGVRFCDIDIAARSYIEEMGYGKYFTHRTGHSIGLEVHDEGDVSSTNTNVVLPGMIFSIEPGIYLPGGFGVRIEDLVVVTDDGCLVLNNYTKELTIID